MCLAIWPLTLHVTVFHLSSDLAVDTLCCSLAEEGDYLAVGCADGKIRVRSGRFSVYLDTLHGRFFLILLVV